MPPPDKSVHFNLGYAVGLAWHTTIVPGGPYALKHRHDNSDPALIAQCDLWQRQHDDWLAGFHAGNSNRKLRAVG